MGWLFCWICLFGFCVWLLVGSLFFGLLLDGFVDMVSLRFVVLIDPVAVGGCFVC